MLIHYKVPLAPVKDPLARRRTVKQLPTHKGSSEDRNSVAKFLLRLLQEAEIRRVEMTQAGYAVDDDDDDDATPVAALPIGEQVGRDEDRDVITRIFYAERGKTQRGL